MILLWKMTWCVPSLLRSPYASFAQTIIAAPRSPLESDAPLYTAYPVCRIQFVALQLCELEQQFRVYQTKVCA